MTAKDLKAALLQEAVQGKLVPPACRQAGKLQAKIPCAKEGQWFVYVIECQDGSFYKGFTTDLQKRYEQHCKGIGAEWTRIHKPKQLFYWEIHYSEKSAIEREKYLKSGCGREWFKKEVVDKPENWQSAHELLLEIRKKTLDERRKTLGKKNCHAEQRSCHPELVSGSVDKSVSLSGTQSVSLSGLIRQSVPDEEKQCLPSACRTDRAGRPFDIPQNWCWVRFGDIFQHNTGKTQNSSIETKNGTLRKFITTSNLYWNQFDFTKVKEMLFADSELERCTVKKGDLLICEGGDYGRSAIWNYDYEVCFQNHIHRARPAIKDSLSIDFYYYVMWLFKNIGLIEGKGVGIKSLSTETLHKLLIPLPPLAEQKRIVAALEKILPLCEKLGK